MAKGAVKDKKNKGEQEATAIVLDFTNVKEMNFNSKHVPEGDYLGIVTKVAKGKSKAGNSQWIVTIEGKGKARGGKYAYYCPLTADSLWKIRNLGIAAGLNVPKKRLNFNPQSLVNKEIGMSLEDDEYEGKIRSKVNGVMPPSDVSDDTVADADVDDEEVVSGKSGGKKGKAGKTGKHSAAASTSTNGKKKGKKSKGSHDDDLEEIDIEEI